MTTGGRRYKHQAMEKAGIGGYFDEIVDRDETYYAKEQGIYYLYRKHKLPARCALSCSRAPPAISEPATTLAAARSATLSRSVTVALSTEHSYNDEETLVAAKPTRVNSRL